MPTAVALQRRKRAQQRRQYLSEDAIERKQQILEAAAKLFRDRGFHNTSLQDIADELGITRPALYHYFANKEDILFEVAINAAKDSRRRLEEYFHSDAPPEVKLRRAVTGYVHELLHDPALQWIVIVQGSETLPQKKYKMVRQLLREHDRWLVEMYKEGVEKGVFVDVDPQIAVFGIAGMCNWLLRWYRPAGRLGPDAIAEIFVQILERGYLKS